MASIKASVRGRWTAVADRWAEGDRHLAYTLLFVSAILAIGAVMVPMTIRANALPPMPRETLLAERYVEALSKVEGRTTPLPTVAAVERANGTDGGDTCSTPLPKLHAGLASRRTANGPSSIDPVKQEQLRALLRVYCPGQDERYAAWLAR